MEGYINGVRQLSKLVRSNLITTHYMYLSKLRPNMVLPSTVAKTIVTTIHNLNLKWATPVLLWHPGILNDSRCNRSSTEAGVPVAITGHAPTPPVGGTYYHWRW
ncbi:hypothetical protein AVEN_193757-1 [Araneus ventricosus]|uniref:Uncharacterized protein n=1 Tax=Araneus ventricosus TaxID=182803 RepID=A0A4Y2DL43_ARAVE|nr:hypothetical protein AVEN_193757-1 [Araneus ventricosus]